MRKKFLSYLFSMFVNTNYFICVFVNTKKNKQKNRPGTAVFL